jgi:transposase
MELRERIAAAIQDQEQAQEQIEARFEVSFITVERMARRLREGEGLQPRKIPGRSPKLQERHIEYLRGQLEAGPYTNSYELAARFNKRFRATQVHRSTILRAMHDLGFTFKKDSLRSPA